MSRIEVDDVSLCFRVRQLGRLSLKEFLVRRMFRQSVNPVSEVKALQRVTFDVDDGERLGIIGHNGAGKSTLLKVLAGIYPPTAGTRTVRGRISSLFEIALGFELDANGWENIAFRGYLQGETPTSIRGKIDEIAGFSELGEFLNMPVRYYSAGMLVRLAFAISTAIEPEILLVDEVLSAGDMSFQVKARKRMSDLISKAQLIVMVSHDIQSIAQFCTRVLWMDHGKVRALGDTQQVVDAYQAYMSPPQQKAA